MIRGKAYAKPCGAGRPSLLELERQFTLDAL